MQFEKPYAYWIFGYNYHLACTVEVLRHDWVWSPAWRFWAARRTFHRQSRRHASGRDWPQREAGKTFEARRNPAQRTLVINGQWPYIRIVRLYGDFGVFCRKVYDVLRISHLNRFCTLIKSALCMYRIVCGSELIGLRFHIIFSVTLTFTGVDRSQIL